MGWGGGIQQVALEEPLAFVLLSPGPPITSGCQFRSRGVCGCGGYPALGSMKMGEGEELANRESE